MLTYRYSAVYIGKLNNLKSSLRLSDKISCNIYDSTGSITERYKNGIIYNLVIKQDIVDGEPHVDLAVLETTSAGSPRFTLSHGTFRKNKERDLYADNPDLAPNSPWTIDMWNAEEPFLPGVQAPRNDLYNFRTEVPVVIFDNLEYCELLILVNGGYAVIKKGWDVPDEASKKKIVNLHDALALVTR